jgi:hypothetical protein
MPDIAQASGMRNHCGRNGSHFPMLCSRGCIVILSGGKAELLCVHYSPYIEQGQFFAPCAGRQLQRWGRALAGFARVCRAVLSVWELALSDCQIFAVEETTVGQGGGTRVVLLDLASAPQAIMVRPRKACLCVNNALVKSSCLQR